MFIYADPEACPVCRARIPHGAVHCEDCDTTLSGSTVSEGLWRTLTHADSLVAELLRRSASPAEGRPSPHAGPMVAAPSVEPPDPVTPTRTMTESLPTFPAGDGRSTSPAGAPGLTLASVPKILLGLGASCLLVAALVFLVVAWASFGQTGRTLTLLALTAAAGAAAYVVTRAHLRAGAETLATLALGLLALDVIGGDSAGWFGQLDGTQLALPLGGALAVAGLGWGYLVRYGAALPRLVAAELIGALGIGIATAWTLDLGSHSERLGLVVAPVTLSLIGLALLTRRLSLGFAATLLASTAALWWFALVGIGLDLITAWPTLASVWGGFACWELLVAAAMMLLPMVIRLPRAFAVSCAAVAVALVTFVLTWPAFDEGATVRSLTSLWVVTAGVAAAHRVPFPWRAPLALPVFFASAQLLAASLTLVGFGTASLFDTRTWSAGAFDGLSGADLDWHHPLLLAPSTLGVLLGGWAIARVLVPIELRPLLPTVVLLGLAPIALTPAMYVVPRAFAIAALLVALTAQLLVARQTGDTWLRGTAIAVAAATACTALGASLASVGLTAVTTALQLGLALLLSRSQGQVARMVGEVLTPALVSGFLWTGLHLFSVEANLRAPAILVAIGLWAILRATWWVEVAVLLTALTSVASALAVPGGADQTWLAADLTVAGVLVTLSALIHPSRRLLGWLGLSLLTLAQWVRMEELGVSTVEAYTLPLAVVLLAVGVIRMRRTALSSTRALASGLILAITPSLILALVEPLSLRAVLVGVACGAAVGVGAVLRWSSPLVVGAVAGVLLVLREATHAQVLPQWVTLALVGLVLITVGATWERRLAELRLATGYVRRLR